MNILLKINLYKNMMDIDADNPCFKQFYNDKKATLRRIAF